MLTSSRASIIDYALVKASVPLVAVIKCIVGVPNQPSTILRKFHYDTSASWRYDMLRPHAGTYQLQCPGLGHGSIALLGRSLHIKLSNLGM